jgi:hypothetical protein
MKPQVPLVKGNLIGYVSPHTDLFFIGRIKRMLGESKCLVKPTNRVCETPIFGDHSVDLCDVLCLFMWYDHE